MAEYELIQERKISGKGVLQIPTDARRNRAAILYVDLVRPAKSQYLNFNYNPPRGRYGTICFFRNNYVIASEPIEYDRQSFDTVFDAPGQTLIALKCAYDGILESFVNLGVALGAVPISVENKIKDFENLDLGWTECRVVCYADTALSLKLYRLKNDVCKPDEDKDKPPPPPPPPPPRVPAGTPVDDISKPYDSPTNDNDNTFPYKDDSYPPPPTLGNDCQPYNLRFHIFLNNQEFDFTSRVWGRYEPSPFVSDDMHFAMINSRGGNLETECKPFGAYQIYSSGSRQTVLDITYIGVE